MRDLQAADAPPTDRLLAFVQDGLNAMTPPAGKITSFARRPSHYRSSYPLEELTLTLEGGRRLELMFKNADRALLTPEARAAKPLFLYDPHREIEIYRSVLAHTGAGTAHCYAALADAGAGHYWLCLETVGGVELYQVGELSLWQRVAAWLAVFHVRFADDPVWRGSAIGRHLLAHDRSLMDAWFDRARTFAADRHDAAAIAALTALEACWREVVDTLTSWPRTLVHGEFYASNILVDARPTPVRVCPLDWEMAADGPGIVDLAALIAGAWRHDEPDRIVDAYVQTAMQHGHAWTRSVFDRALICARVYIAVQWLGWARDWAPPAEHRHDWASVLSRLVAVLRA